jgi:hypothetical protein
MNKQIAAELGLAEITVKIHRGHIMKKMGARCWPSCSEWLRRSELVARSPSAYKPKYDFTILIRDPFCRWAAVLRQALCSRVRKDRFVNSFDYLSH